MGVRARARVWVSVRMCMRCGRVCVRAYGSCACAREAVHVSVYACACVCGCGRACVCVCRCGPAYSRFVCARVRACVRAYEFICMYDYNIILLYIQAQCVRTSVGTRMYVRACECRPMCGRV